MWAFKFLILQVSMKVIMIIPIYPYYVSGTVLKHIHMSMKLVFTTDIGSRQ